MTYVSISVHAAKEIRENFLHLDALIHANGEFRYVKETQGQLRV